jgi:hypothetical protein
MEIFVITLLICNIVISIIKILLHAWHTIQPHALLQTYKFNKI